MSATSTAMDRPLTETEYQELIERARCRIRKIDAGARPINKVERSQLAFFVTIAQGFHKNTVEPFEWNPEDLDPIWVSRILQSDPDVKRILEGQ